jgi:hypothetical protein
MKLAFAAPASGLPESQPKEAAFASSPPGSPTGLFFASNRTRQHNGSVKKKANGGHIAILSAIPPSPKKSSSRQKKFSADALLPGAVRSARDQLAFTAS